MARHRDDEDFSVITDPRDFDAALRALPKFPRQDDPVNVCRVKTRPLDARAAEALEKQLEIERRVSEIDGRVPIAQRIPGQGSARSRG